MSRQAQTLGTPRLRRLVARQAAARAQASEHCDLCGVVLPDAHRHLLDLDSREVRCACRACSLLFDRRGAGAGQLRLIGDRRLRLDGFVLGDPAWETLRIPVEMAFFFTDSRAGRVAAFYPSPMGATESQLELDTWAEVVAANPVLADMEPDVEALLVNRVRGARRYWLVPIEDPYRLVALIRTRWRGFTGGREVWSAIEQFFDELDRTARPAPSLTAERN